MGLTLPTHWFRIKIVGTSDTHGAPPVVSGREAATIPGQLSILDLLSPRPLVPPLTAKEAARYLRARRPRFVPRELYDYERSA